MKRYRITILRAGTKSSFVVHGVTVEDALGRMRKNLLSYFNDYTVTLVELLAPLRPELMEQYEY